MQTHHSPLLVAAIACKGSSNMAASIFIKPGALVWPTPFIGGNPVALQQITNCKAYLNSIKKLTALFALLLISMQLYAGPIAKQDSSAKKPAHVAGKIYGTVLDEYSQPLIGANIRVKGKADTSSSKTDGQFEINGQAGNMLIISHPGHISREVTVKNDRDITVKLDASFLKMPENTDVLYGVSKRANMLGSVATIYTNQLTSTPASLYVYALPGQLAGLYTKQNSGFTSFNTTALSSASIIGQNLVNGSSYNNGTSDNSEFSVSVRGQSPITVIDGVQREISSIDPEAIESISVLKDGLSTILLGINSSRPVILVTTKRGEVGKPRISFTANTGVQQAINTPQPLPAYQYAYLLNETLTSDGKPPLYTSEDFKAYQNHTDPQGHPDVNWQNTLLKNYAPLSSYKLNINGGSSIAKYSVSLGYFNQGGMFKTAASVPYNTNNDLSRYIVNSDVGVQVNKNLYVALQLFGRIQTTSQPGSSYSSLLQSIYSTPNNAYPIYNLNGTFGGNNIGGNNGPYSNNLLARAQYSGYTQNNADDILANLDLNYNLGNVTKGLSVKLKGNLSYQSATTLNRSLQNSSFGFNKDSTYNIYGSTVSQSNNFNTVFTSRQSFGQASVNYDRQFGKNSVNASVLYDARSVVSNYDLAAVTTDIATKAAYNYDGKYFLEAAVNRSGNNRYPPGRKLGTFYAGGISWQIAKENFLAGKFSWLDSWKLRATYAKTGQDVQNIGQLYYAYAQTYGTNTLNKTFPVGSSYNNVFYQFENILANPYIRWQGGDKVDIGTDICLFKNHLLLTADYYHDRYFDVLGWRGNSIALLGTGYPLENIGKNLYQGGELTLTYQSSVRNFNYFMTGNANLQTSKILFNDELKTPYPWNARTGTPVNDVFYGYESLGLYQTAQDAAASAHIVGYSPQPGDIKYKDLNSDGIIDQFDRKVISGSKPLFFYGLNLGFNYKGLSFTTILQGVRNRKIMVDRDQTANFGFTYSTTNGQAYLSSTGRWTPENAAIATLPRLAVSGFNNNSQSSTFYLRSGDYLRLKNAEVAYSLPYQVIKHLRISGLRVFINGENLLTLSGFKGLDPEVMPSSYPIQRVYNAGLSIKL